MTADESDHDRNSGVSHRFEIGTRAVDTEKQSGVVVVDLPDETSAERAVPGTGQTVADFNEEYNPESPAVTVVFESALSDTLPEWDSLDPEELRAQVGGASIREYDYPEPRLRRQAASVPDEIDTYHELISYQHARLIQLAAGIPDSAFLWRRYQQIRDGEFEMASITKEDKYQLRENFGVCVYCKEETETTFDHVIPLADGGPDDISNQVPACESCNLSKSDKDVIEWCKERGEPVPRVVWGKYLKQYREQLERQGRLHSELPENEREKWDGVEIQRNITDRIFKQEADRR